MSWGGGGGGVHASHQILKGCQFLQVVIATGLSQSLVFSREVKDAATADRERVAEWGCPGTARCPHTLHVKAAAFLLHVPTGTQCPSSL